jgi:phage recombination protein Bet
MGELLRNGDSADRSGDRMELLARTIAKGASPDELALFSSICERTGLDPFTRQIYLVPRWDAKARREVFQPQVSIDGARLTAQRSGQYEGQTEPMWCGSDGEWRSIWLKAEPPFAARVGAYRAGFREPCVAVALWTEYCPKKDGKPTGMWGRMPALMLAKCAEMLALRKAFPAELSGLYSAEEMAQAANEDPQPEPKPERKPKPAGQGDSKPAPVLTEMGITRKVSPDEVKRLLAPAARTVVVDPEVIEIDPKAAIMEPFDTPKGRMWRLTLDGDPDPIAITDETVQSTIEANCAFGVRSKVRIRVSGTGKRIVSEVLKEAVHA